MTDYFSDENPHRSTKPAEISREGLKIGDIVFFGFPPGDSEIIHNIIRFGNQYCGGCSDKDIPFIHVEVVIGFEDGTHKAILVGASGGDHKIVRTETFEDKLSRSEPRLIRVHRALDLKFSKKIAEEAKKILKKGLVYSQANCLLTVLPSHLKSKTIGGMSEMMCSQFVIMCIQEATASLDKKDQEHYYIRGATDLITGKKTESMHTVSTPGLLSACLSGHAMYQTSEKDCLFEESGKIQVPVFHEGSDFSLATQREIFEINQRANLIYNSGNFIASLTAGQIGGFSDHFSELMKESLKDALNDVAQLLSTFNRGPINTFFLRSQEDSVLDNERHTSTRSARFQK